MRFVLVHVIRMKRAGRARHFGTYPPAMTEDSTIELEQEPARRRKRRWTRWLWRGGMLALALPILFSMVAVLMLYDREISAPSWVKNRIETQASGLMSGGSVTFGDIIVTVQSDLHPRVRMHNIVFRDAEERILARVPQVEAQISPRGLLFRRELLVQDIHLNGAQFTVRRSSDGSVAVTFQAAETTREAVSFLALLDGFDSMFEAPALEALREVKADGLIVNFEDARAGRSWTIDGGALTLDLKGQVISLRGEAGLLSGRPEVTTMSLSYESLRSSRKAVLAIAVKDAYATDIASQSPVLSWLGVLDAPMSAAMRATIDDEGALDGLFASFAIDEGTLRPSNDVEPVPFEEVSTHLTFHPQDQRISFDRVSARSAWGSFNAQGQAYLQEFTDDFPGALVSQLELTDVVLTATEFYDEPQKIETASVDFRMRLAPFSVHIGEFYAKTGGEVVNGSGQVNATPEGWTVALDATSDRVTPERLSGLWPKDLRIGTRRWIENNLSDGYVYDAGLALRLKPGEKPDLGLSWQFEDMSIRYMRGFPSITNASGFAEMARGKFTASLDSGKVTAPQGGELDVTGSVFHIGNLGQRPGLAEIDLNLDGTATASLAVIDLPPFEFLTKANRPVTLVDGRAVTRVQLELPLKKGLKGSDVSYRFNSQILNLRSDLLLEGHTVSANEMTLNGDKSGLKVTGDIRVGDVPATVTWDKRFSPEFANRSSLTGSIELSQRTLDEFRVSLPPQFVGGTGRADLDVTLSADAPPQLKLTSDLSGISAQIPALSWSKPASSSGSFVFEAELSEPAKVDTIALRASGLAAEGRVSLKPSGGFDRAQFDRLSVDGWFNAPVELIGQGEGKPVDVRLRGGALDLRTAKFGQGSDGASGALDVSLDRLQVSEGIALTNFRGNFQGAGGFNGSFTGQMNGGTPVQGRLTPQNGGSAVQLQAADAGALLRSAGLMQDAQGGRFDLTLIPTGTKGNYDGQLAIGAVRIRKVPAVAELLNAVSVVGLLQALDGPGILFDSVDATFRLTPNEVIITRGTAVGASLGISLEGIYTLANKALNFQGVLSPVYVLNGIGAVLSRPGEGLFGFNYTLGGTASAPDVGVNALSALAPGGLRDLFRAPGPTLTE